MLYSDGELVFNNTGKFNEIAGKTILLQTEDVRTLEALPWASYASNITTVTFENKVTPNYVSGWFSGCSNLTAINNLKYLDTKNVTDMSSMFNGCEALVNLDITNLDTTNVTTANSMFNGCTSLSQIDLTQFRTKNLIDASNMFKGCSSLTKLDLSSFNTSVIANANMMFYGCENMETIDMRTAEFADTVQATDMFASIASNKVKPVTIIVKNDVVKAWIEEKLQDGNANVVTVNNLT